MYSISTTPGFIINSKPYGEAGKIYTIFTRDLGLVFATAQGIRLEKSKLRYHMHEYSFGTFSFVRGKEFWRLTSAASFKEGVAEDIQGQELLARIALLLRRLLHGEESHPKLFECLESCDAFLRVGGEIESEDLKTLESLVVLRMLQRLGYVSKDPLLADCFLSEDIDVALLGRCISLRPLMNQYINKALRESQL